MTSPEPRGVVARVIAACAHHPGLTLAAVAVCVAVALNALRATPLDAIPDLSDTQVIVFTEWMGRGPDLVEDQVTYPITSTLLAAPRVKAVRAQSMYGMSFVYAIFEDGTDPYWARSRVLEYLASARARLPADAAPTLGPDATGVGWVFQYALVDRSGRHDLQELRALQDWNLRYALASVPGVAEVASVGGAPKQYQVEVDPTRLYAYGVTLRDVVAAVRAASGESGGGVLELAGHEQVIRGRGWVREPRDLELAPVRGPTAGAPAPVLVRDVATVSIGAAPRRGVGELNGDGEAVGGIVVMRYGQNALDVIDAVKARLDEARASLPEGVEVVTTYDRSELIRASIATLTRTLVEEMIVVALVIAAFLMHARSALVAVITLPIAVVLAFLPMAAQHLTANIMSLGGIAVAIGAMVDASIIMLENAHKRLETAGDADRRAVVVAAMQEVGPSLFFALLVITASFLPIFALEGAEGRLFRPLASTKTYAMAFAAILAVTLVPALTALLVRGRVRGEHANPINRWLARLYAPVVRLVVRRRWIVIACAVAAVASAIPPLMRLESEFMPPLNEGAVLYMPTAPPGMSVDAATRVLQAMDHDLRAIPEVVSVFGKMGRAESATDPAPIGMVESTVVLKPREAWRPGLTWEALIAEMDRACRYPGMPNIFWMPIQTRTEMLATGIRSPLGVLVSGDDLAAIERAAIAVERAVADVPGTRSAFAERSVGGFFIDVRPRRADAARLGVSVADIDDVVATAIGGQPVAETVEGRARFAIAVRYARDFRDDPERLGRVLVATPSGAQVPLATVADIVPTTGAPMIRSEGGRLAGYVFIDVAGRGLADYVGDARHAVASRVTLPPGVRLTWTGQWQAYERASARLRLVVPATLAVVALLLWLNTRSWIETLIVLLAVPFSLVGAVWLLAALHYHLSVAVWVGMIALAGLDAETGVVMLLYLTLAWRRRREAGALRDRAELTEAIVEGAAQRIRPKLMTALVMLVGLMPILWSHGTGADVMKRIAAPMVGGIVTSFLLELTVYPAIFAVWRGRGLASDPKEATTQLQ